MRTTRPIHSPMAVLLLAAALLVATGLDAPRAAARPQRSTEGLSASPASDWAAVETLAFATALPDFLRIARDDRDPAHLERLDWSTDLCSAPLVGDTGRSFDFAASCRRHDFGYRNLHLLERRWGWGTRYWNPTNRERVDRQFLADMLGHCAGRSWWLRWSCRAWAWVYFVAVRSAGGFH